MKLNRRNDLWNHAKSRLKFPNYRFYVQEGATDDQLQLVHDKKYINELCTAVDLAKTTQTIFYLRDAKLLKSDTIGRLFDQNLIKFVDSSEQDFHWHIEAAFAGIPNINKICDSFTLVNGDVSVSGGTMDASRYAAGAAILAVDIVLEPSTGFSNALVLSRPPGHHAGSSQGTGYCAVNSVALAAKQAVEIKGFRKVVVFDMDAHHGNGTQEIFTTANRINDALGKAPNYFYISIHWDTQAQHPGWSRKGFYPYNASAAENVKEIFQEQRTVFNYPVISKDYKDRTDMQTLVMYRIQKDIPKVIRDINPDLIIVSCGVDGHEKDPYSMGLTTHDYYLIGEKMGEIARDQGVILNKKVPVISVLEGGYNKETIGEILLEYTRGLESAK